MKSFILIFALYIFSYALFAQDTPQPGTDAPPAIEVSKGPALSVNPSATELAELFSSKEINQSEAVERVAKKGDNAVAGLSALLLTETKRSSQEQSSDTGSITLDKIPVVLALDNIGSPQSSAVLVNVATTSKNREMRGVALNALNNYYGKSRKNSSTPTKEIIETFFQNGDDQTQVPHLQKRVSQIAQEGLLKWLGLDFGDPQFEEARILAAGGKYRKVGSKDAQGNWDFEEENKKQPQLSASAYAKIWWEENKNKLVWDKEKRHFIVETNSK